MVLHELRDDNSAYNANDTMTYMHKRFQHPES